MKRANIFLVTPVEKIPVTVDLAPYMIVDYEVDSDHKNIILKTNLTDVEVAKVLSIRYKYDGLDVTASLLRKYPYKEVTSHVIGNVGYIDTNDLASIDKKNIKALNISGKLV